MKPDSDKWKQVINKGCKELRVDICYDVLDQFSFYATELLKWNKKFNLTAITDPFEVAVKHFIDSAAVINCIPLNSSLIDIGTGPGFPGLVLKILNPSLSVVLIDSSRKKISFLKYIIRSLKLTNIDAYHIRAQELAKSNEFVNSFDIVTSRAFSELNKFVVLALPFLKQKGSIIALKGKDIKQELDCLKKDANLNVYLETLQVHVKEYMLPFINAKRSVIEIKQS